MKKQEIDLIDELAHKNATLAVGIFQLMKSEKLAIETDATKRLRTEIDKEIQHIADIKKELANIK